MAFSERVEVLIDVVTDRAGSALSSFRTSVGEADGVVGKFKAGASSAFESIQANAGALAMAGGAALISFGIKAVGAFTDTAKAAIDFGAATGTSVEEASRWIAVGDDMGVSADALQGALGKVGKELDADKWQKYGIATRDAAGEARSTNDIFLDTLDMLSGITNETERTRVGTELFGKAYANIAPMIGKTREEYEAWLAGVEKGQVITAEEAEKAERMRQAQDALNDALGEVTLAFGQLVAELAPTIESMADAVTTVVDLSDKIGGLGTVIGTAIDQLNIFDNVQSGLDRASDSNASAIERVMGGVESLAGAVPILGESVSFLNETLFDGGETLDGVTEAFIDYVANGAEPAIDITDRAANASADLTTAFEDTRSAAEKTGTAFNGLSKEANDAEQATRNLDTAYRQLSGQLSAEEAWLTLQENIRQFTFDMASGKLSVDEQDMSVNKLSQDILKYVADTKTIPDSVKTDIISALQRGDLDTAISLINSIPRTVIVNVKGQVDPSLGSIPRSGAYAQGGDVASEGLALVGEYGPEYVRLPFGSKVYNATETAAMQRGDSGGTYIDNRQYKFIMPSGVREIDRTLKRRLQINYDL